MCSDYDSFPPQDKPDGMGVALGIALLTILGVFGGAIGIVRCFRLDQPKPAASQPAEEKAKVAPAELRSTA